MTRSATGRHRLGITRADLVLTGALLALTLLTGALTPFDWFGSRPLDPLGVGLLVLIVLPVLVRRSFPLTALGASMVAHAGYHPLDYPHEVTLPSLMVLIYTVSVTGSRHRLWLAPVLTVLLVTIAVFQDDPPGIYVTVPLGWLLLAAVLGEAIRLHRAYLGSITERAERAEHTREEEAARRVAEERLRIARDLHDALAHRIVVINAHAGVAVHLLAEHEGDAVAGEIAEPLRTVATASSGALAELRTTLDVLRGTDGTDGTERQPTPGLDQLPSLAEATGAAGVPVARRVEGEPRPLGQGVEITLYRIAQEALTNVVKHSGAGAATLLLCYRPGEVRLEVRDDGTGMSGEGERGGYGIIGMTERAAALGGTLTAGPTPGGFTVEAVLPAPSAEDDR
ncbi:sensor histidine kinase [Amycolatopsis cihanbeyliensis]|uniref:histidine kinase n=1 Tax=Amycolatopsis cihanbeyliensis TaxID=1128664 RepID=A0A542CTN5_AMYCI|nr:sensor histidine kinase [Amycolatopsis cihanbeyliensis]TQI94154.1 histidine kinase [Amycolatopsis cihanbeyliensis]